MGGLPFTNNLYIRSRSDNQREIQLLVYHWGRPWCNIMFLLFLLRPRLQLLPLVGIFASTRENYLIYDSNTTALQYTVDPAANVKWGPFGNSSPVLTFFLSNGTGLNVNNSLCYDNTVVSLIIMLRLNSLINCCIFTVPVNILVVFLEPSINQQHVDGGCSTSEGCSVQFAFTGRLLVEY